MVIYKLLFPTALYFSFYHANSIAMFYIVHKYKKKFESTNMDLTHVEFLILLGFPVRGMVVQQLMELCHSLQF